MKLKVCGMKYEENIKQVMALEPDYMGFIFYEGSKRFVGKDFILKSEHKKANTKLVGVFVNEKISTVIDTVNFHQLDYVQLHGNEPLEYCKELSPLVDIIKVFGVNEEFDFSKTLPFMPFTRYFMFDTATATYGGSGEAFNWEKMKEYSNQKPFFLSGGVSMENISQLDSMKDLKIHAIDVNSRFETSPGLKDIEKLKALKEKLKLVNS